MGAERSREATVAERLPVRPESLDLFRLGRLLVLLSTAAGAKAARPLDLERLGYYDFFAANPFLVFGGDDERRELVLAGFDSRNLSYQSSAQRFTNRRARLQYDLSLLVSYGLVRPEVVARRVAYGLTDDGGELAEHFESLYARSYRKSAKMVVARLNRLTDTRLREDAKRWLRAEALLIDLYDEEAI
jgi:hypothetical protein